MGENSGRLLSRRQVIAAAIATGATHAFAGGARPSRVGWREARERYPEGVASGDPHPDSVLLWTRREPLAGEDAALLWVEVAEDAGFTRVVATSRAKLSGDADWTCRVLVGSLKPDSVYWYRFSDSTGAGSRIGRTVTAPERDDHRPVAFAFVSCQNANLGPLTAWRRMIFDDERAAAGEQLGFVLHLGDFVYDTLWYPEDRPQGYYDRHIRPILTYPSTLR